MTALVLDIHICEQRRSYRAVFATEDQALEFCQRKSATHAISELRDEPLPQWAARLLDWLYPQCEHGLSADLCHGPQHYAFDDDELRFHGR